MSTEMLFANDRTACCTRAGKVKQRLLAGATCSSHLTPELLELTAIQDILVWIHKVYIDILFFFCARNPIEMNFPQNISNSELVSVADYLRDHGRMEKVNTIRY